MNTTTKNDDEAKAARIQEATSDWLESQVFPTISLVAEGSNLRRLSEFVSPKKEPIDIGRLYLVSGQTAAA